MSLRSRLRPRLRRARDAFPLTWLGVALASMSGLALWVGVREVDLVFLGASILGAIAVLFGLALVAVGTWRVKASLRGLVPTESPRVLECGYPVRTGFTMPRLWYLPGLRLTWRWDAPESKVRMLRAGLSLEEEVLPSHRGWRESLTRRITVGDPFGLAAVTITHTEARPVRMLPSVGGLKSMHVIRTLAGGSDLAHPEGTPEGDRLDLRQYAPGDPIRYMLWRVFARTRELVVRQPERALSAARKTMAYLVSGSGDEPAAGAARVAVDVGALGGDWAFGADGVAEPAETKEAALEALARSATAPPEEHGRGLARFIEEASPDAGGRTVVFCPGRPGPWLDGILESAKRLGGRASGRAPLEFVVCTDGVRPAKKRSWLKSAAVESPDATDDGGVDTEELQRVVAALQQLRANVIVVDRRDGHVHTAVR